MKLSCLFLAALSFSTTAFGRPFQSEFKEPWRDTTRALVLDPYRKNRIDWDALATEPRVAGIIHKASEFFTADSKFAERRAEARRRGYKWGSYHLGRPGNPIRQADLYLATAQPAEDELMALDLEDTSSASMNVANALRFVKRIREKTGRYPLLYVTDRVRMAILRASGPNSDFAKTPLWYARYRADFDITRFFPTALWPTYTLWQFASEINCPSNRKLRCPLPQPIPGTDYEMDVNVYYGTVDELRRSWPFVVR